MPRRISLPSNQIQVVPCSWDEFRALIARPKHRADGEIPRRTLFRGQTNPTLPLWATIDRPRVLAVGLPHILEPAFHPSLEARTASAAKSLQHFRQCAAGLQGYNAAMSDLAAWELGRHFGLHTPLLDWTESPYVAAYFAYAGFDLKRGLSPQSPPVAVWALEMWEDLVVPGEFEIVEPDFSFRHRQVAQASVYTWLASADWIDVESYLRSRGLAHCLCRYELTQIDCLVAMRDLRLSNIRPASLFPDLFGAAMQANSEFWNSDWDVLDNEEFFRGGSSGASLEGTATAPPAEGVGS